MADFEITSPDGKKFVVTAPEGATQDQVLSYAQSQFQKPEAATVPAQEPYKPSMGEVIVNAAGKGIAALPDSILNAPNKLLNLGKAAVGTAMTAAGHPPETGGPLDIQPDPDFARRGAEAINLIRPEVTPQTPIQRGADLLTQGAVGGALTGGANPLLGAGAGMLSAGASGAAQAGAEKLGYPEAGAGLAAMAGIAAPTGAGALLTRPAGKTPLLKSSNPIQNDTFTAGNAEGLKVPPSAMKSTWLGDRVEGLAGKAALGQQTAKENQPVINTVARREAGLQPDEPISVASLTAAREKIAAPYREVAAINKYADHALTNLKQARADSTIQWQHYERSKDPESLAKAKALDAEATHQERVIDAIASKAGNTDLLYKLRDARMQLAKNYNVERALNTGNGNVDASVLGRMYDHDAPLTGGLQTIAKFQQAFPSSVREASKVPAPGVSKLEGYGALAMGVTGHMLAPGTGDFMAALPLAISPAARRLALSPYMQGGRKYGALPLSELATRTAPLVTSGTLAELQRRQAP